MSDTLERAVVVALGSGFGRVVLVRETEQLLFDDQL